ncbi:sugar transporter [Phaeobacter gallaeciensis]|uniref:Sugar transporter n=1 Tax=Phaeobacter gallaeciensis TaxID=60890 RepID=A0ABD4XER3_9RHOB|nr:sugar transporter [Phaeobacter gallaeciensis]MDE4146477.1 sugar transporter [Phaeobacter gallaeciensis]MDE4159159.1 sugar transporter [Phaeobacter gallaeciensis]MDE4163336.1 sugar transporter [Phaeobacter gallaeciensis]MDE4167557.1 sugar transporter [Phaeobacter gallaeciensis]MDE4171791.1 sugar transporter [Phaeobacter gallaeciensis]
MGLKTSGQNKTRAAGKRPAVERGAQTGSNVEQLSQVQDVSADQDDAPGKGSGGGARKKLKKLRQKVKATEAALEAAQQQVAETPAYSMARPAQMRRRHWGLVASFVLMVLAPLAAAVFYLWALAEDQYISTAGFTVRSQESSGATDLLGGLANFTGNTTASDSDILYEFIQSQEMVESVDKAVPLRPHYSQHWPNDWVFSLWPDATLEQMIWYWQRIVGISYDSGSGLIEVQAVAFDSETAREITRAIVAESQTRINELNEQAREDAMRYAREDLDEALEQLKGAREALTQFRTRTRIVDPEADIQGRMGVMNNLQQQLASALIEYDLLRGTVGENDPRLKKAQQHIDVIRERINIERQTFTSTNTDTGGVGEDYPSLISEFERLTVDLEYAEETYRAALTALEVARDEATRQSRYLATYIKPTRAQESEYPNRPMLAGLAGLFLLLTWSILALIYYSIRDRS